MARKMGLAGREVPAGADGAAVRTVLAALGAAPDDSNGDRNAGADSAGEARSC